jgi:hypothetical protein
MYHASPARLHYRGMEPIYPFAMDPGALDAMMEEPSPPPASLPIAKPTGPFDPKNWVTPGVAKTTIKTIWKTTDKPFATAHPAKQPFMPVGPPVGDIAGIPDTRLPQSPEEYQEWLNSLYFGQFNNLPAVNWQQAGFGPREEVAVATPPATGHLPVVPEKASTAAPATATLSNLNPAKVVEAPAAAFAITTPAAEMPQTKPPPLMMEMSSGDPMMAAHTIAAKSAS